MAEMTEKRAGQSVTFLPALHSGEPSLPCPEGSGGGRGGIG